MTPAPSNYEVVWPRGKKREKRASPASRLPDLNGKTVAVVWNYVFRGEEIFPLLESELTRRFPGVEFVKPDRFGNIHGSKERQVLADLPARLKEFGVDAVISGNGC
ncbi:MAG: hypothetical protein CL908_18875 [Deltaproteobacteria bacterium]|jgi:hypothetical protein|nr:hypothetical protein [Deltaproteobacteria bacterium]